MKIIWLTGVSLVACASNEAATAPTTVTSAEITVEVDTATERITTDRCDRQISCGNIGRGRRFGNRSACESDARAGARNVLGRSCSTVDPTRLRACLDDIRNQPCEEAGNFPLSCEGVRLCR